MQVKFVNQPKPGKKLGNVKTADNRTFFFDPAEFAFTVGASYEIETKPLPFGNDMLIITKVLPNAAPQGPSLSPSPSPAAAAPKYAEPNAAPWFMPFVSNTVAHAIAAGHIQTPAGIREWALGAKNAALSTIASTPPTTDEDVPF